MVRRALDQAEVSRHRVRERRQDVDQSRAARSTTAPRELARPSRGRGCATERSQIAPGVRFFERMSLVRGIARVELSGPMPRKERRERFIDKRGIGHSGSQGPRVLQQRGIDCRTQTYASHAISMPRMGSFPTGGCHDRFHHRPQASIRLRFGDDAVAPTQPRGAGRATASFTPAVATTARGIEATSRAVAATRTRTAVPRGATRSWATLPREREVPAPADRMCVSGTRTDEFPDHDQPRNPCAVCSGRRGADDALSRTAAVSGPLLDHTENAIVAFDADWHVTVCNEGARRLFGWTAEVGVGQPGIVTRVRASDPDCFAQRPTCRDFVLKETEGIPNSRHHTYDPGLPSALALLRTIPANRYKYIGAPGFEPGTSPTRIMGEISGRCTKYLQIDGFWLGLTTSQNLGFCGGFTGFRQGERLPAK